MQGIMTMKLQIHYLTLCAFLLVFAGCNTPSPEEMYNKALESQKSGEFGLAIEGLNSLIKEHPNSQEAEAALFQIATIYTNETKEFPKAVEAYNRYLASFPSGSQAPLALFMVGYLNNNELHNVDAAAVSYRMFLEKYPNHEMAQSAQFELDNLGKPPEELVPPLVATGKGSDKASGSTKGKN